MNDDTLTIDNFEFALIGTSMTWYGNMLVERCIYDGVEMVKAMVDEDGMTEEEAIEYIDFNIVGAYVGESTPIIMWPILEDFDA